jgi:hypothetical protein
MALLSPSSPFNKEWPPLPRRSRSMNRDNLSTGRPIRTRSCPPTFHSAVFNNLCPWTGSSKFDHDAVDCALDDIYLDGYTFGDATFAHPSLRTMISNLQRWIPETGPHEALMSLIYQDKDSIVPVCDGSTPVYWPA